MISDKNKLLKWMFLIKDGLITNASDGATICYIYHPILCCKFIND